MAHKIIIRRKLFVLNALRHQRFWQIAGEWALRVIILCSTPCGIRGFGRVTLSTAFFDAHRAQRLAASEVLADQYPRGIGDDGQCSTPCGIRGFGRAAAAFTVILFPCSTPCGIRGFGRRSIPSMTGTSTSAQRLAASEVLADKAPVQDIRGRWCSTPCGIRGFGSIIVVASSFNANCAQRLAASEVLAVNYHLLKTYTQTVLNALRHQRFWQKELAKNADMGEECSTPCGIRGFGSSHAGQTGNLC